MKKGLLALAMILVFGFTANVALTDEVVVYPFFQHGWGCTTFWSVANTSTTESTVVTINMLAANGTLIQSTVGTVAPGQAWLPDTGSWDGPWYVSGDRLGFGNFDIQASADTVYLWACIYGTVTADGTSAGYTLVLPQNPYGVL